MSIETSVFTIDSFRHSLQNGGARSNQFLVQLTFPTRFVPLGNRAASLAPFLVTAASLPSSSVNQTVVYYRGRPVKLAGERDFAPWSITVLNDSSMVMRTAFEAWQNGMNNLQDNSGFTAPEDYIADFTVTQLDRNSNPLKSYTIRGAFPIEVSEVPLDFGANDQISSFNVTFAIQDYSTDLTGSPDDGSTNLAQFSQSI